VNTVKFTVPDRWTLRWSYDCSSFGLAGNFIVAEDGGADVHSVSVNQTGNNGHGISRVSGDAGSHFLSVDSECSWSLQVVS
jgi:hypothetical protein